jgi:hypothetical protein
LLAAVKVPLNIVKMREMANIASAVRLKAWLAKTASELITLVGEIRMIARIAAYRRLALMMAALFNPDGNGNGYSLDYGNWDGAPLARPTANRLGNILGTPATFKLSVGYRF